MDASNDHPIFQEKAVSLSMCDGQVKDTGGWKLSISKPYNTML
jgi:hypothetical protein